MKKFFADKYFSYQILITFIITLIVYFIYISGQKMLIFLDIGADTYSFAWPMNAFINDLLQGDFTGFWSFKMGLGANIFSLGKDFFNPANLFIALFPNEQIHIAYLLLLIIFIFVLALLSNKYLKLLGLSPFASMIGGLVITFSGYFICWGQMATFSAMFIMFIFILYAFERWFIYKKWLMLLISVALMASTEFYFFYMVSVFMLFYVTFRYIWVNQFHLKKFIAYFLKTVLIVVGGISLGLVLILPQAYTILSSMRIGAMAAFDPLIEYFSILFRVFSNTLLGINNFLGFRNFYESPFLYTSLLTLFILPIFFTKPLRNKKTIIAIIITIASILVPNMAVPVFNMFSANSYRWLFILIPVAGIATGFGADYLNKEEIHKKRPFLISYLIITTIMILYLIFVLPGFTGAESLCIPIISAVTVLAASAAYLFIFLTSKTLKLKRFKNSNLFQILLLVVLSAELCSTAFLSTVPRSSIPVESINTIPYFDNTATAITNIKNDDNTMYRINKTYSKIDLDDPLIQSYYGEKMYNTCISADTKNIMNTFQLYNMRPTSPYFYGLEDRQLLRNLLAFKYMLTKTPVNKYNYELVDTYEGLNAYYNKNYVPFLIAYGSQIPKDEFDALDNYNKQCALYNGFVSDKDTNMPIAKLDDLTPVQDLPEISIDQSSYIFENMEAQDSGSNAIAFRLTGSAPQMYINLLQTANTPILLTFTLQSPVYDVGYLYYAEYEGQLSDDKSILFSIEKGINNYQLYIDCDQLRHLRLNFGSQIGKGSYTISNLSAKIPLFDVSVNSQRLASDSAKIEVFTDNYIKASYNTDTSKMLFFQTPYDIGWHAFVNGTPVAVSNINNGFCGIPVQAGESAIELQYTPPYLKKGALVSFISLAIIVFALIYSKRKKTHS